jgi:hypothetical protein
MVRTHATKAAKYLLNSLGIEDDNFKLRRILTQQAVTVTSCSEARDALMRRQNSGPLEAIIRGLLFCNVEETMAFRICGVDEAAARALRTLREARASKRPRHGAGADSDAAATSARNDGAHGARLHRTVVGTPARLGRVVRLCTPSPPLAFFAGEGADASSSMSDNADAART